MASELSFDTWTQIAILISITAGIFSLFTHHMNFEQILKFLLSYETFYYFLVSSYFHFKSCKTIKY
jgi:hypothetical protein